MRNWERPMAVVDAFVANEFVSACGDENKEYLFTCDAGGGDHGNVYLETNGKPGLQKYPSLGYWADKKLGIILQFIHVQHILRKLLMISNKVIISKIELKTLLMLLFGVDHGVMTLIVLQILTRIHGLQLSLNKN